MNRRLYASIVLNLTHRLSPRIGAAKSFLLAIIPVARRRNLNYSKILLAAEDAKWEQLPGFPPGGLGATIWGDVTKGDTDSEAIFLMEQQGKFDINRVAILKL